MLFKFLLSIYCINTPTVEEQFKHIYIVLKLTLRTKLSKYIIVNNQIMFKNFSLWHQKAQVNNKVSILIVIKALWLCKWIYSFCRQYSDFIYKKEILVQKWSILSSKMIYFFLNSNALMMFLQKITTSKMYYKSSISIKEWCYIQLFSVVLSNFQNM